MGARTDPAVIGVKVDVAAAHDGDDVPAGETVSVFEDRRDAERGRRLDDQASVYARSSPTTVTMFSSLRSVAAMPSKPSPGGR